MITHQKVAKRINDIQEEVKQVLDTFRIYEPPIPDSLVTKIFGGNVYVSYIQLAENVYGRSHVDKATERWYVFINNIYSREVQRFTLFHELYHILKGMPGYSRGTMLGELEEFYADLFSANLLIPATWLRQEWIKTHDLAELAEKFGVPKRVVELRLNNEVDFTDI